MPAISGYFSHDLHFFRRLLDISTAFKEYCYKPFSTWPELWATPGRRAAEPSLKCTADKKIDTTNLQVKVEQSVFLRARRGGLGKRPSGEEQGAA